MSAPAAEGGGGSLKLNIAANYAGQLYVGVIGILLVPVYLHIMSAEAYGLIGFFALLQAWSQLLDLGLSATVSREAARFAGRTLGAGEFRRLLRSFEWLFWSLGLLLGAGLALNAAPIAEAWLHVRELAPGQVRLALQMMALAVALRWIASLYRGVLVGMERQLWLNGFNALVTTLRFVAVIPLLLLAGATPVVFFAFQLAVSVLELAALAWRSYSVARLPEPAALRGSWQVLRPALRFSAGVGVATVVWVLVTQADKLVISGILPLAEYGYFTAAVAAASAISLLGVAVSQALMPRLTQLAEQPGPGPFLSLYRSATQWTVTVGGPLTLCLALFAEPLLLAWTGNAAFAARYAPVLALYAAGNGFAALAVFPYCIQYARGNLRLHVWGNLVFALVLVPTVLHVARVHGAIGSGWVWALSNAAFFVFWTPLVHRLFAPGLHATWLLRDVLQVLVGPALIGLAVAATQPWSCSRAEAVLRVAACGLAMTVAALAGADGARARLRWLYSRRASRLP